MIDEYPPEEAERRSREIAHRLLNTPKPTKVKAADLADDLSPVSATSASKASATPPKER